MCSFIVSSFLMAAYFNMTYVNHFNQKRGPDATHIAVHKEWTFVHNLLSMTGEFKMQPFISHDKKIAAVFNGEIYNYQDIAAMNGDGSYKSDGYSIIPAYQKYGVNFTQHLKGEYAVVVVDFSAGRIVLSTDVFSTKPFYYGIWTDKDHKKRFATASYKSVLTRLGCPVKKSIFLAPNTVVAFDIDSFDEILRQDVKTWDLRQYKMDTTDWEKAFMKAVETRVSNIKHNVFIGLSSGYDSGAIMLALLKLKAPFMSYTIMGQEDKPAIEGRIRQGVKELPGLYSPNVLNYTDVNVPLEKAWLRENMEPYAYKKGAGGEVGNDKAAHGLSAILRQVRQRKGLIYLSGSGADEIITAYAMNGKKIYPHASFDGIFPEDLSSIFPWESFYGGTQRDYLMKEEHVGGAHGIESRYPFLDQDVVQEFLWLHHSVKNTGYKKVMSDMFDKWNFPYVANWKVGFSLKKKPQRAVKKNFFSKLWSIFFN